MRLSLSLKLSPLMLTMVRVVKDAIEHRGGEHAVAGEGAFPAAEGEIRGEDRHDALVAARDDLEEQIGLLAGHRQIADLTEDQQPVGVDRAMHDLAIAAFKFAAGASFRPNAPPAHPQARA